MQTLISILDLSWLSPLTIGGGVIALFLVLGANRVQPRNA